MSYLRTLQWFIIVQIPSSFLHWDHSFILVLFLLAMITIDVIVLTKNNVDELIQTITSVPLSHRNFLVNILIFDGSSSELPFSFFIDCLGDLSRHLSYFWIPDVRGIYPSMNFALSHVKSDWFIFLNSGDYFHADFTLASLQSSFLSEVSVVFGQAEIKSSDSHLSWLVPDSRVTSIDSWLHFFEPNHQAIFARNILSKKYSFQISSPIGADAAWKRKILCEHTFAYVKRPFVVFNLGGASSTYSYKILRIKLNEQSRSLFAKLMEIAKYLLFKLGIMSPRIQLIKSRILGLIF